MHFAGIPNSPTNLKVSKMKHVRSMMIEWKRPSGSETITGYYLLITKHDLIINDTRVFDTSNSPKYIYYFQEDNEFQIKVTSFNSRGNSSSIATNFRSEPKSGMFEKEKNFLIFCIIANTNLLYLIIIYRK